MLCGKGGIGWPCGRLAGTCLFFGVERCGWAAPLPSSKISKKKPRRGRRCYRLTKKRRLLAQVSTHMDHPNGGVDGKHQRARTQGGTFPACPYCIWTSANSRSRTVRSACRLSWVPYGSGSAPSHAKASRSSESQADGRRMRMSPVRSRRSNSLPAVIGYHCFPPRRVGTCRRFNSRDTAL
jgi:hypothetical protein